MKKKMNKNTNNKKDREEFKKEYLRYTSDGFFKKPVVKLAIGAGVVFGALYLSRYFMNASAEAVRAYKNLRQAVNE